MRILWVKVGGLWPPHTGGRLRSFHLVSDLSRRHRVIVLTTHAPGEDAEALSAQLPGCERVVSIPCLVPKQGSARFLLALMRSWASVLPVDLAKFRIPRLQAEVRRLLEGGGVDLCVADFLSATVNVPCGDRVPVLFFAHNVEHMIWKRMSQVEHRAWRRLPLELEWRKMRRQEARACERATLTAAVSEADVEVLSAEAPAARLAAVPTGVDISYFRPEEGREVARHLVFTGSMDWHPNEDAVLHFMRAILPRVRAEMPGTSFSIVGRNPGPRLRAEAARYNVLVTGTVSDVRPHMAGAEVIVVPLRVGGGTRIKIFEALAMGKAVVSTTIGAEGLPLVPGTHILLEDDPIRFAREVVSLLRDPSRRRALGFAGRRLVEERFSWPSVAREFEARCAETVVLHHARPKHLETATTGRRAIRSLLPAPLARLWRACRNLDPRARSVYWRLKWRRALGRGPDAHPPGPAAVSSVLFVCHGNILRSPMAAALLEHALAGLDLRLPRITSAGLQARLGERADPRGRTVAREFGVNLDGHRTRPLTGAMVAEADLIVALDSLVEAALIARHPEAAHKIRLPLAGGERGRQIEIDDPYDGDVARVRRCYRLLRSAIGREAAVLSPMAFRRSGPWPQEGVIRHAR